ncbi:transketolase : Transketolase, central region:Transketolase, C terminal OS=Crocosphaera watsonii WH 8501 GN=CwatDRAFT_1330 PE=4 SV=1: Transket_pyr: Transketolase_C [Gemmataceae bacterium]|nr:transketolase : Transketolase, central region:Transketolase, C terminal OS=Crocosphaera watsonii WH 8501 GN=CwatDRAFT_1330 PE=4 SV=1: Transket_pyr: Transketolase_C [Gemmataceae bacterium]VTT99832.1 transketolase : Transketolase, central region:Transketolase, C terminal OS=Crocosphaera watsonii WH 8501 GN=CwatDRAFT_1330 PE=4 SV=1: Transket_pyr: Transketolase_C [Gemmataceae bacterium]
MRERCLKTITELARTDERIVFVGSDLGVGVMADFKAACPDRFFMEGVAEQNLVGLAAGMAMEGRIVFLNTIATFLTRRCYEQVVVDLGMHNANVRLIANGGGVVYAPLGPTHLATDDIAIMRAIPNMTILAPADAEEMERATRATVDHQGPVYVRVAKGHDPVVTTETGDFQIGRAVPMRDGHDALIVTTGVGLQVCLAAANQLTAAGIDATVLHMPTIKPLDTEALGAAAERVPAIVTVEEHSVIGGLGSAVAEYLAEADLLSHRKFRRIGFQDVFPSGYGDQNGMMRRHGISADAVAATVQELRASRTRRHRAIA